ncbi:unnamed protein product [Symbiodinium necroappetens]|uniref:Uncharacterized protein n=1 Tax=Symbiodinium necroappetens TaxID=1628268 RepID=A0A813CB51_9DINO|nr:unnamed protein product [Symbiodinium necroappetens]
MASGLVQDMKPRSLQDARDDMESCALSLGGSAASRHKELLSLMKLDQASRFPQVSARSASPVPRVPCGARAA